MKGTRRENLSLPLVYFLLDHQNLWSVLLGLKQKKLQSQRKVVLRWKQTQRFSMVNILLLQKLPFRQVLQRHPSHHLMWKVRLVGRHTPSLQARRVAKQLIWRTPIRCDQLPLWLCQFFHKAAKARHWWIWNKIRVYLLLKPLRGLCIPKA